MRSALLTALVALGLHSCAAGPSAAPAAAPSTATPHVVGAEFLPANYQGELFVDWAAARETGLVDRLLRFPMAEVMVEGIIGPFYDHEDVLTVRTAILVQNKTSITVATVRDDATQKSTPADWPPTTIGPHAGIRHGTHSSAEVSIFPRKGLQVDGSEAQLQEAVRGDHAPGCPHPDLLPLLAGDRVLFHFVYGRFGQPYDEVLRTFGPWFGDREDPVDFVRLRLKQAANDSLVFAVTLRFANGTTGLRACESMLRGRLDQMLADRKLARLRPILGAVVITTEDHDLTANLVLGSAKEAVAKVEQLFLAVSALREEDAQPSR